MRQIKNETGLKIITEVATPQHVENCLKTGFDAVWIGARTVSNPFSVQQIADALAGAGIPVFIKNPMSPDIDLWIGAIERVKKAGIKKTFAIHRGFHPYEKTRLRNIPKWELALELKTRCPNLPILCDASHISGKSSLVPEICQYALDLSFDGLMIEVHHHPPSARSDKQQQLTPDDFDRLMKKLVFKAPHVDPIEKEIIQLRSRIDSVDMQLLELIALRMGIVKNIGLLKQKNHIAIFQLKRWKNILETRIKSGKELGISEDFLYQLLEMVHRESIRLQTKQNTGNH
jgi:chorismate mutase